MESSDPRYKHKPSEKHTLEEVLKSLQDLIRVDLSEDRASSTKQQEMSKHPAPVRAPAETRTTDAKTSGLREDFAPQSPASGPVNLDAVLRSLKDLIGNELNTGEAPKPVEPEADTRHEEYLSREEEIEEYVPEELSSLKDELSGDDVSAISEIEPTQPAGELHSPELEQAPTPEEAYLPSDEEPIEAAPHDESLDDEPRMSPGGHPPELEVVLDGSAPEEFTPLDEELTFEQPVEPAASEVLAESTDLPGEITPELLEETAPDSPPVSPVAAESLTPGTQHEIIFEDQAPGHGMEKGIDPESAATSSSEASTAAPVTEDTSDTPEEPLPVIEVVETFEESEYFPYESVEEGLSQATPSAPEAAEEPTASEDVAPPAAEMSEHTEETIDLDKSFEPAAKPAPDAHSVDFDVSDLTPPLPEEPELSVPADESAATSEKLPPPEYSVDFEVTNLSPPLPEEPDLASPSTDTPAEVETAPATPESEHATAGEPAIPAPEEESKPVMELSQEPPRQGVQPTEAPADGQPSSESLDDLPVLKDVVSPPVSAKHRKKPDPATATLPAPDRAREIVVRAVAKLNVEMRKSGGAGLDTRTILRLQQLIRQELEKDGGK